LDGRRVVAIQASAGAALKSWPLDRWAAVADRLAEDDSAVLLTGAPADAALLREIAKQMTYPPAAVLCGQSLDVSAAIFERCALLVGLDGGAAHLAAAVGTPTTRLYGPASPAIYGPWPPNAPNQHVVITEKLACVPCGYLESPPCGARSLPACLLAIDVDEVVELARAHLRHS
jgi:heptosyltransferase-2/heptosyltransferase-3